MLKPIEIASRVYTLIRPIDDALNFNSDKNYFFDLSYLTALEVIGNNSKSFLQGQITCNVNEINENNFRQTAICNIKGRVLALFDILFWNNNYLMVLPEDLVDSTLKTLMKPAMLSRVNLKRTAFQIFGLYLNKKTDDILKHLNIDSIPTEEYSSKVNKNNTIGLYHLGNNFYIILSETKMTSPPNTLQEGSLLWHYLAIKNKKMSIYPQTKGLFLPHRLDLHLSHSISFDKGCYKGQEIIARMQYKGTVKHNLRSLVLNNIKNPSLGETLFGENGQTIGELIDYAPCEMDKHLSLVSLLKDYKGKISLKHNDELIPVN